MLHNSSFRSYICRFTSEIQKSTILLNIFYLLFLSSFSPIQSLIILRMTSGMGILVKCGRHLTSAFDGGNGCFLTCGVCLIWCFFHLFSLSFTLFTLGRQSGVTVQVIFELLIPNYFKTTSCLALSFNWSLDTTFHSK